ncbi:carboxypeptidase-like regulatory domain-containing protein [Maribacter sp. R77961]|uniref:carboxypeptidase-like regulatory domain-containing protein n=1 Tax=Maribacter sp. R77961 TaxID=3093871 RepID=UPI0037CA668D
MKKKFYVLFLLVTVVQAQQNKIIITGKVTDGVAPIEDVNISVSNSDNGTKTDANGYYSLNVKEGALLRYSYVGLETVEILVEDVSRRLNIKMTPKINQLENVTVTKTKPRRNQKQLREDYYLDKNLINTAFGIIDKESVSYRIKIIEGGDLPLGGIDFLSALQFRYPGLRVERMSNFTTPNGPASSDVRVYFRGAAGVGFGGALFDVDGMVFTEPPTFIAVENIERIAIITGLNATGRYGFIGNGGVIVINQKNASYGKNTSQVPNDLARLRNNIFENDAIALEISNNVPEYLRQLRSSASEEEAKKIYGERLGQYRISYHFMLDAYQYFSEELGNDKFANSIIEENKELFNSDPLALKALAYNYQKEGRLEKANELYKELFILRANYGQSYMDLANSYREIGEYKKAATMYARYGYLLDEGFLRAEDDLNIIIERELNNLIALKGEDLLSKKELKNLVLDDEFDGTRLVFEWNDSEAEFELQFVNPEGNYYKSEHSLFADADRIKNEKISGFSSEEYLIDESVKGVWKVNAKYFGNKSLTPTYLKATIYHNYGSASQRKETKLFKLSLKNVNQQLFTVSNMSTVVGN